MLGHSIQKLIDDFLSINSELYQLLSLCTNSARVLDRLYIPTRYPVGLPDLTPEAVFSAEDAQDAYERSNAIVAFVKSKIKLLSCQVTYVVTAMSFPRRRESSP